MIISKKVLIKKPTGKYFKYYKDLGYDVSLTEFEVHIEHLSHGSKSLIDVECDYCKQQKKISYVSYNRSTKNNTLKYSCSNCGHIKQKELCLDKWGVKNYFQLEEVKNKIKETNISKWGVDNYTKTGEYREKSKKTSLEKWGVDNYTKTDEFKERFKKTSLENWGVDNYTKTDEFKERFKKTSLENWGVEHPNKSEEVKNKIKETNISKWGVDHYSKTNEFKEILKNTSLENWGVDHYSKTDEYKEKIKKTLLEKFGVDHYSKTNEFKEKFKNTSLENWGVDNYSKTDEYKEKVRKTSLDNWGVDNYTKTDEYKERFKKTSLENWGVEHPNKSEEVKNKIKDTNISKWGVDNILKSDLHRERFNISKNIYYIRYLTDGVSLFKCDLGKDHTFEIKYDNFFHRNYSNIPLCTICNPIGELKSIKEKELFEYIKSIYDGEIIQSWRDGIELDIYIPNLKLGFEFNGLYWHSDKFKNKNYHLDKSNFFKEKGIRVIHIWEDDWIYRRDIVVSQIYNFLNLSKKIFARKCKVVEIENKLSRDFLNKNHIQGSYKQIVKSVGLYFDGELISVMTFDKFEGRKKMEDGGWNLSRFCNKIGFTVVGGASKLLKYFIKTNITKRIISFSDKDWSFGNLYEKIGFVQLYETKPDYKYIILDKRIHKSNFKKNESYIKDNYFKIWDCGKIKYQMIL